MLAQFLSVAHSSHVAWDLLAAIARDESNLGTIRGAFAGRHIGLHGSAAQTLPTLAAWLASHGASWNAARPFASLAALQSYYGSAERADRVAALAAYYWAIGPSGATSGLAADQPSLERSVLGDKTVRIYAAGLRDINQHRIDTRVLMTIRYLDAAFGRVTVTSLISGAPIFTTGGGVSAHVFGRAVNITALGKTPILNNQGPATVTERAIRLLLMLPRDVAPRQIISLMALGGGRTPNTGSFAMPDATDHIQISY
jgi:hypothetical protein